jgi:hypothetical protein
VGFLFAGSVLVSVTDCAVPLLLLGYWTCPSLLVYLSNLRWVVLLIWVYAYWYEIWIWGFKITRGFVCSTVWLDWFCWFACLPLNMGLCCCVWLVTSMGIVATPIRMGLLWCVGTPYCLVCGWLVGFSLWFWTPSCCLAACADAYCLLSFVCCCLLVYDILPLSIFGLGYYGYFLSWLSGSVWVYELWLLGCGIWAKEVNTKEKLGWK